MKPVHSVRMLADLRPGDHVYCLYETDEERRALVTSFVHHGLERGEKVLYLADAPTVDNILDCLRDDGLHGDPLLTRRQLVVLDYDDVYPGESVFDPYHMIALLRAETKQALTEGYSALRVIGEMTWGLRGLSGSDRLIEYEARLNEFLQPAVAVGGIQCLVMCQYDRRRFDPALLLDVLRVHPMVVIGVEIYDNICYNPSTCLVGRDSPATKRQGCIQNLIERKRMEETLHKLLREATLSQRLLLSLSQTIQAILCAHTPDEVYRAIMDQLAGLGYCILIFDLTTIHGQLSISRVTFDPTLLQASDQMTGALTLDCHFPVVLDGFLQQILEETKTIMATRPIDNIAAVLPEAVRPLVDRLATLSGLEQGIFAPITIDGNVHGLLVVMGSGLSNLDILAVTSLANQVAITLEKIRLCERVYTQYEQIRQMSQQILSVQEEERRRLSRELHDDVGQALTALKIDLEMIHADLVPEFDPLRQSISKAIQTTGSALERIRLLAQGLHPPSLETEDLSSTLESLCQDFAEHTQLHVDYVGVELPMLPQLVTITLYRLLQEALTNVVKHAQAHRVYVTLRSDAQEISLSVEDDGQGFDRQIEPPSKGIGLQDMRERLTLLGGWLEIESRLGCGTRVVAHIPWETVQ